MLLLFHLKGCIMTDSHDPPQDEAGIQDGWLTDGRTDGWMMMDRWTDGRMTDGRMDGRVKYF